MRLQEIHLTTNDDGHLCIEVRRALYGLLAVVLCAAVALMSTRWGDIVADEMGLSARAWWVIKSGFVVFAGTCIYQAVWGRALVFDARLGAIMRGDRMVTPFANVSHVQLLEHRGEYKHQYTYWTISVQLLTGRPLRVGRETNDVEADLAAAHLATALGKPVKYVVR